jgi:hypothetical protein
MDGGQNFIARMTALQDGKKAWDEAKAAQEKALTELRLGQEARAALDGAEKTLAEARTEGIRIVNEARAQAKGIVEQAQASSAAADRYASEQRTRSDAAVAASDREASGRLAVAKQEHEAAVALRGTAGKANAEVAAISRFAGQERGSDPARGVAAEFATLREALKKVG